MRRVVRAADPDAVDRRILDHRLQGGEGRRVAHAELAGERRRLVGVDGIGAPHAADVAVAHRLPRADVEAGHEPAADEADPEPPGHHVRRLRKSEQNDEATISRAPRSKMPGHGQPVPGCPAGDEPPGRPAFRSGAGHRRPSPHERAAMAVVGRQPTSRAVTRGRLRQSVSRWCYAEIPLPDLCKAVAGDGRARHRPARARGLAGGARARPGLLDGLRRRRHDSRRPQQPGQPRSDRREPHGGAPEGRGARRAQPDHVLRQPPGPRRPRGDRQLRRPGSTG